MVQQCTAVSVLLYIGIKATCTAVQKQQRINRTGAPASTPVASAGTVQCNQHSTVVQCRSDIVE
jgi:hypothetical protein